MMARKPAVSNELPEGTDDVFDTNAATEGPASSAPADAGLAASGESRTRKVKAKIKEEASNLKGKAADTARDYANQGKAKATSALGEVSSAMEDAAGDVDSRFGEQYGEYARMAASAVSGFASRLESKDVDDLLRDAEDLVRKSPVVAIGIAAVAGFAIARLIKSGFSDVANDRRA